MIDNSSKFTQKWEFMFVEQMRCSSKSKDILIE